MSFLDSLTTWFDKVQASQCSGVVAEAAKTASSNEAVHKALLDHTIDVLDTIHTRIHADALTNASFHAVITIALLLNFLAVVGLIIAVTPALREERDRHVTPVVKRFVRILAKDAAAIRDLRDRLATGLSGVAANVASAKAGFDNVKAGIMARFTGRAERRVVREEHVEDDVNGDIEAKESQQTETNAELEIEGVLEEAEEDVAVQALGHDLDLDDDIEVVWFDDGDEDEEYGNKVGEDEDQYDFLYDI